MSPFYYLPGLTKYPSSKKGGFYMPKDTTLKIRGTLSIKPKKCDMGQDQADSF
jgi:hypothetical protein